MAQESGVVRVYLIAYNFLLALGWLQVLVLALYAFFTTGYEGVWAAVEWPLKIWQTAAVLEIVNVAVGFVPSSLFTTFVQVLSRVVVLWLVCDQFPQVPLQWSFTTMVLAWAITEVIRYGNYLTGLLKAKPYFLLWARYTFFYLLYPIGAGSECLQTYAASLITQDQSFSYFLLFVIALYIPIFPMQYGYMIGQRSKYILGDGQTKKVNKKTQ